MVAIPKSALFLPASPGPVGNMTVTSPSVDQLTVTWTPPTTGGVPTSYNVTISDSSSPVVIGDNGSPVYTHTFTGLVSDTLYTVSVVAINCAGSSNGTSFVKRTSISVHSHTHTITHAHTLQSQWHYHLITLPSRLCLSLTPTTLLVTLR